MLHSVWNDIMYGYKFFHKLLSWGFKFCPAIHGVLTLFMCFSLSDLCSWSVNLSILQMNVCYLEV
jgi:hypothetical protein